MRDPDRSGTWVAALTRAAAAAALAAVGVLAGPVAAHAVPPDHDTFSSSETFVDDEVCAPEGFSVDVTQTESGSFRVFFAPDGGVARVLVHMTYFAVIRANGHAIVESDRWQDFFYPDGSSRSVGLTVLIRGSDGNVQHDSGQLVFAPDGSLVAVHGPHPQALGETFCSALLP